MQNQDSLIPFEDEAAEDQDKLTVLQEVAPVKHWSVNKYIEAATSDNTRKAYRSDIAHYEASGGRLPASPGSIMAYLEMYADKLNSRTLSRRLIAIRHWHTYQGFADPSTHPAIQKTIQGILRTHGKPKNKARAISPEELALIVAHLENENSIRASRDAAFFQIGFFGALRRSELVAIDFEHVSWNANGIEILLPNSKTDQLHEGQYCAIPYGNDQLCPVRALKSWLDGSGIQSGAIFRPILQNDKIADKAMSPHSLNVILKKRAKEAGLIDIENLSCHSLRRGLATSAALAGTPLHAIMRAGRWKQTNTVMEYIEAADRFIENAADKVLQSILKQTKLNTTT